MICNNCGKNTPFIGKVCNWCGAEKTNSDREQSIIVTIIVVAIFLWLVL